MGIGALAEVLLWLASCYLPDPQADACIARAAGCVVDVIPAGHAWLGDLHLASCWDLKGENKFPLTLHPKE